MNSALFTFDKYISRVGFAITQVYDFNNRKPKAGFKEIGRCLASSLVVRPRPEGEAIMLICEENNKEFPDYANEEFWFHIMN